MVYLSIISEKRGIEGGERYTTSVSIPVVQAAYKPGSVRYDTVI